MWCSVRAFLLSHSSAHRFSAATTVIFTIAVSALLITIYYDPPQIGLGGNIGGQNLGDISDIEFNLQATIGFATAYLTLLMLYVVFV